MPIKEAQDASCASLIAFVRAMLFVDDDTRITQLSLHGEGNETRIPLFSHCQNKYTHMWKNNTDGQSLSRGRRGAVSISHSQISIYP